MAAFRELEMLVAKIQKHLAPDAEVTHNVRLLGRRSGAMRQIDVLMRQKIGQFEINIVIDSKDHAAPVDLKGVEEFSGLVGDVGAQKGVLVSPRGFTKSAKRRATDLLIALYSPVDTGDHKWKVDPSLRTVCEFRTPIFSFNLTQRAPHPLRLMSDFYNSSVAYDAERRELGPPLDFTVDRWNAGELPLEVGEYRNLQLYPSKAVLIDNGYGTQVPVEITLNIDVERRLFLGQVQIEHIMGFKDEIVDGVITRAFTTAPLDLLKVEADWKRIESFDEVPGPAFYVVGINGWKPRR